MIKHILSDGRCLDSIEGYKVPINSATLSAYKTLKNVIEGGNIRENTNQRTVSVKKAM